MQLSDILTKYGWGIVDKGTDKNTTHAYGPVYDELFSSKKESTKKILEIGIQHGMSLIAFSEYFQNATLYGLDIEENCLPIVYQNPNIKVYIGNALLPEVHTTFTDQYDIIIEDASHTTHDQIKHFKDFAPKLAPGGIYVIEDIAENNYKVVWQEVKRMGEEMGYSLELRDLRSIKNRFDDILIIARRPSL